MSRLVAAASLALLLSAMGGVQEPATRAARPSRNHGG